MKTYLCLFLLFLLNLALGEILVPLAHRHFYENSVVSSDRFKMNLWVQSFFKFILLMLQT